jgi:hypothetical protein
MVFMYSGIVNSSTSTAACAIACTAAISTGSMSRERFLIACGGATPKTGISIGVSRKKNAFRTAGRVIVWPQRE